MVGFTPLPLYPRGNISRYLLDKRRGGPQARSGRYGEERNLCSIFVFELCNYCSTQIQNKTVCEIFAVKIITASLY
jgi:hypothetical protein